MNKAILIHNDNVKFIDLFGDNNIKFEQRHSDLDTYISEDIIKELREKTFDTIYIKDNLSTNYLELLGLRVALHIRLSSDLDEKRHVPIIILSDIDSYIINKLNPMANLLFTKNIFIISNTKESFKKFESKSILPLSNEEYKEDFLDKITIKRPKDTSGDHDIANQWAIYRWAEFLKVNSEAIKRNKDKISSLLYFKYLVALKSTTQINEKLELNYPNMDGTILYIDDQWSMGWQDIYKKLFSSNNIDFKTIEEIYKIKNSIEIQSFTKQYIRDINPDLVILDLRLHSDDNVVGVNDEELNGIKILKYIKQKVNPGIQVILLTASGKSNILDTANKHNILGYIKKEHPSDHSITTQEKLIKLSSMVDSGLNKKYLKSIYTNMKQLKKILDNSPFSQYITDNKKYKDYSDKLKLEISYIYNILDSNTTNKYPYEINHFLNKKLGYKADDIKLNDLIQRRNSYVHSNSNYKDVTKDEIKLWYEILLKILKIVESPPNYIVYDRDTIIVKPIKNFNKNK